MLWECAIILNLTSICRDACSFIAVIAEVQRPQVSLETSQFQFDSVYVGIENHFTTKLINTGLLPCYYSWSSQVQMYKYRHKGRTPMPLATIFTYSLYTWVGKGRRGWKRWHYTLAEGWLKFVCMHHDKSGDLLPLSWSHLQVQYSMSKTFYGEPIVQVLYPDASVVIETCNHQPSLLEVIK